jgi:hypothetical protein
MQKAPCGAFGGLFSGPNWIRTNDRLLRRQLLYPTELWGQNPVKKCRGGRIRTYDLLLPKQARYRATLHPEKTVMS